MKTRGISICFCGKMSEGLWFPMNFYMVWGNEDPRTSIYYIASLKWTRGYSLVLFWTIDIYRHRYESIPPRPSAWWSFQHWNQWPSILVFILNKTTYGYGKPSQEALFQFSKDFPTWPFWLDPRWRNPGKLLVSSMESMWDCPAIRVYTFLQQKSIASGNLT